MSKRQQPQIADELEPQKILNQLKRIKDGFSMSKGKAMDMITEANSRQWDTVLQLIQTLLGENQKLKQQRDDFAKYAPKAKVIPKTEGVLPPKIPKKPDRK